MNWEKPYRRIVDCAIKDLRDDLEALSRESLRVYEEFTGVNETNVTAMWHYRVSLHGEPHVE